MSDLRKKNLAILGSTGSIGQSTLGVVRNHPGSFHPTYLTAHRNIDLLVKQVQEFQPTGVVVLEERNASVVRKLLNGSTEVLVGEEGLIEVVSRPDVDLVVSSLVGFAGVRPTIAAIDSGKDVALANKETLVVAGNIIMEKVRARGVQLTPVDSEHSAILQCLRGERVEDISRLILTASGGPFLHLDQSEFQSITVAEALNHPTWRMGNKITIDSATLMNKGLEVIEAHWLFGLPPDRIDVVIHPQSIIHSMVEFTDGSIKAQLGIPDMKIPIQYALMYPHRPAAPYERIDFATLRQMTFQTPDVKKFPCLNLAYEALRTGGTVPTVLNAANEVAVRMFLDGRIPFSSIPGIIDECLALHTPLQQPSLDDLIRVDAETRDRVRQYHTESRASTQTIHFS